MSTILNPTEAATPGGKGGKISELRLLTRFGITEKNLAARRESISLGEADQALLTEL